MSRSQLSHLIEMLQARGSRDNLTMEERRAALEAFIWRVVVDPEV